MRYFLQMLRRQYWTSVVVATILPGISAAVVQYWMTGGLSGWIPIWSSLIGGGFAATVLLFIKVPEVQVREPSIPDKPSNERIFINKKSHELIEQINGLTSVAAEHIIGRYKGYWMRVQDKISDVSEGTSWMAVYTSGSDIEPGFVLYFDKNWFDRLKILEVGDSICVIGQIEEIITQFITLENCEIVDGDIGLALEKPEIKAG